MWPSESTTVNMKSIVSSIHSLSKSNEKNGFLVVAWHRSTVCFPDHALPTAGGICGNFDVLVKVAGMVEYENVRYEI